MSQKRIAAVYFTILICLAFLAVRLYALSGGNESSTVLSGQYSRRLDIAERSGFIYDRNISLMSHFPCGISVTVNPSVLSADTAKAAKAVSQMCDVPLSEVYSLLSENKVFTLHAAKDAQTELVKDIDGIYLYNIYEENFSSAVHLTGYKNADGVAQTGLLKACSSSLSSLSGKVYARYEANAMSRSMDNAIFEIYDEGYTKTDGLVLTLDTDLQAFTDSLGENLIDKGTVIIADANSGDILALSSYPAYDSGNIAKHLGSDRGELINRATCLFTPGSVFKLIVSAAALEADESLYDFSYECTGSTTVGESVFRCHNLEGHGKQDLSEAFANSCNTYFIELGRKIGASAIIETANRMGVGKPVSADFLDAPAAKLIPKDSCSDTLLANISFGQGPLLLSPLDFVNVTNCASSGFLPTLSLIKGSYKNGVLHSAPKNAPVRVLSEGTSEKLRSMMKKCVQEGTGTKAFLRGVSSGGKTATAQTGQLDKSGKQVLHTWFCGIYPASSPKYSIIILCDGNGRNPYAPAEIFKIVNKHLINCGY